MGVPTFFRWLSEKYPKIILDILEKRPIVVDGVEYPVNLMEENPIGTEYDNLYIDMNGLIHPCSHPEDREAPSSEEEMYGNVMKYVDRLFACIRPRRLLFLAVDGVAPRAKMNQQRSRRFRAARDAKERHEIMENVRQEMIDMGLRPPPKKDGPEWDSNVITPGTEYMSRLSLYIWYYVLERMNHDPAWRSVNVIFSDASEPGEGEHKIMKFIRYQRSQPGYDPNQKHVIHGLDADLIMLALATHEAHFTILREKVTFGKRAALVEKSDAEKLLEAESALSGGTIAPVSKEDAWVYSKPLQGLQIHVLREYLGFEFNPLSSRVPFTFDFERIVDDFVFICFFVGNDFLPHLPSLDIREGALEYLIDVYKGLLPSLGNYLTSPGGNVNLSQVDVMLAKVGEIEELVFKMRKAAEDAEKRKLADMKNRNQAVKNAGGKVLYEAQMASEYRKNNGESLITLGHDALTHTTNSKRQYGGGSEEHVEKESKKRRVDSSTMEENGQNEEETSIPTAEDQLNEAFDKTLEHEIVEEASEDEDDEEKDAKDQKDRDESLAELKRRVELREQAAIERYKETVTDHVRFHEEGWKERYYGENFKKEDIIAGGGKERMFQTYVEGLCWVFKYYYDGCPSWNWFYPFHYAPFASDMVNIDKYDISFTMSKPFRPTEQLLAVLPADSVHALPEECQWLMTDTRSPIIDIYTSEVPLDPNGQHLPWLWILLLPFVDENRISEAFELCKENLSMHSRKKNAFGHSIIMTHSQSSLSKHYLESLPYESGHETDREILSLVVHDPEALKRFENEEFSSRLLPLRSEVAFGLSGSIAKPPPSSYAAINKPLDRPILPNESVKEVPSNNILCLSYSLPDSHPHKSELLPGAIIPPPLLTESDSYPRRPRLGRGRATILDMLRNSNGDGGYRDNNHGGRGYGGNYRNNNYNNHNNNGHREHNNGGYHNNNSGNGYQHHEGRHNNGGYNNNFSNNGNGYQSMGFQAPQDLFVQHSYPPAVPGDYQRQHSQQSQGFSFNRGNGNGNGNGNGYSAPPPPPMDALKSQLFAALDERRRRDGVNSNNNGMDAFDSTNSVPSMRSQGAAAAPSYHSGNPNHNDNNTRRNRPFGNNGGNEYGGHGHQQHHGHRR